MTVTIEGLQLDDPTHGSLPATILSPEGAGAARPLCLFLFGGGGNADNLRDLAPVLEAGFADGTLAPMTVACLGVDPWCFYLDDPARRMAWETAVAEHFVALLRGRHPDATAIGLVGISMGGYGALKIALSRPARIGAVAAVAPMLEPSTTATGAPPRNRFHYPPTCPPALVGDDRDAALFERDHPATRAREHAAAIAAADLPIYLDAGSRDVVHAHDGAEFLHRVLWDLDLRHEYHLHRDADHVGPTVVPRLRTAFAWVGARLRQPTPAASAEEVGLQAMLAEPRAAAAALDPTVDRAYGRLP